MAGRRHLSTLQHRPLQLMFDLSACRLRIGAAAIATIHEGTLS